MVSIVPTTSNHINLRNMNHVNRNRTKLWYFVINIPLTPAINVSRKMNISGWTRTTEASSFKLRITLSKDYEVGGGRGRVFPASSIRITASRLFERVFIIAKSSAVFPSLSFNPLLTCFNSRRTTISWTL